MKGLCLGDDFKKLTEEYLILVDKDDNPTGTEEKVKCHMPDGKLHRAFTVLIFDTQGKLLLTKRSSKKMLWPAFWDGTVASHPRQSETYVSSSKRRLVEEIGVSCDLDYLFKFEYHVPYKDVGSENEICGTLIGVLKDPSEVNFSKEEISEITWMKKEELMDSIEESRDIYCPWMILALYFILKSNKIPEGIPQDSNSIPILSEWINTGKNAHYENNYEETIVMLKNAISFHFPDEKSWELKDER